MDHSYEEIRDVAFDILAGRVRVTYEPDQYEHLKRSIADVLESRAQNKQVSNANLSRHDSELFLELFWDLFRKLPFNFLSTIQNTIDLPIFFY